MIFSKHDHQCSAQSICFPMCHQYVAYKAAALKLHNAQFTHIHEHTWSDWVYNDELAGTRYLKELLYNNKTYTIDLIALNLNKTIDIFKSYINIVLTFFVFFFFLFFSVVVFNL